MHPGPRTRTWLSALGVLDRSGEGSGPASIMAYFTQLCDCCLSQRKRDGPSTRFSAGSSIDPALAMDIVHKFPIMGPSAVSAIVCQYLHVSVCVCGVAVSLVTRQQPLDAPSPDSSFAPGRHFPPCWPVDLGHAWCPCCQVAPLLATGPTADNSAQPRTHLRLPNISGGCDGIAAVHFHLILCLLGLHCHISTSADIQHGPSVPRHHCRLCGMQSGAVCACRREPSWSDLRHVVRLARRSASTIPRNPPADEADLLGRHLLCQGRPAGLSF